MMNFAETPSVKVPREFLAVILAGFGSELQPLTSNYGDQPCPKALLPIGNKPMISYVLNWVEEAGLKEVLLICPTAHRDAISHHIHSDPSSSSLSSTGLNIDIQTLDQQQDLPAGTASVLAHFANKIAGDFVLLPCDFIPPKSLRLETVLDKFRAEAGSDGALATALFFENSAGEHEKGKGGGGGLEEAWGADDPPPAILYDEKSGTLLHVDTLDDRDRNGSELELRMATLWQYPRTKSTTKLVDAHVYVCRHAVLDALQEKKERVDSIREEFLPWLCKLATHRTKQKKYAHVLYPKGNSASQALALRHSTSRKPALKTRPLKESGPVYDSAPPSPLGDDSEDVAPPTLRVGLAIHRLVDGLALRAHTVPSYLELNRAALINIAKAVSPANVPASKPPTTPKTPKPDADGTLVDPKANVGADCLVGASAHISERSTLKRTAIGNHCVIGKGAKLVGCVLMEYCIVEEGAKLDGCILGKNTKVGAKAELVRCITQAGYEVEPGGVYKHEKLEISDWASGAVDHDEDEEDEEDEDNDKEQHDEGETGSEEEEEED